MLFRTYYNNLASGWSLFLKKSFTKKLPDLSVNPENIKPDINAVKNYKALGGGDFFQKIPTLLKIYE